MRILANYGYKNNGDNYSVTFETMGDVPRDLADSVVDDLFRMAKAAIQRQVNPEVKVEEPKKESITIPEPRKTNGNGNGNGNGKHHIKDPSAPVSPKQKSLIIKLAKERGRFIDGIADMTMADASKVIEELLAVSV